MYRQLVYIPLSQSNPPWTELERDSSNRTVYNTSCLHSFRQHLSVASWASLSSSDLFTSFQSSVPITEWEFIENDYELLSGDWIFPTYDNWSLVSNTTSHLRPHQKLGPPERIKNERLPKTHVMDTCRCVSFSGRINWFRAKSQAERREEVKELWRKHHGLVDRHLLHV